MTTPRTLAFAVRGPIARADLAGLCERVCGLLGESGAEVAYCDVRGIEPDAVTVDALARLQLAAGRAGCTVRLRNASPDLRRLVAFMGLAHVLGDRDCGPPTIRAAAPGLRSKPTTEEEETVAKTSRMLFVNLAVEDLERSVQFFTALGFTFDPRFTDETATAMVVSEQAVVMLLTRDRFAEFTKKRVADPAAQTEAIMALSADTREDVDRFADRALAAGGSPANEPIELGFMYGRSFDDPDGHLWEIAWMDPQVLESGGPAAQQAPAGA